MSKFLVANKVYIEVKDKEVIFTGIPTDVELNTSMVERFLKYIERFGATKEHKERWHSVSDMFLGEYLYEIFGYRKYYDTQYLENIYYNILSKMLLGMFSLNPKNMYFSDETNEEILLKNYNLTIGQMWYKAIFTDWEKEDKEKTRLENLEKINKLQKEIERLKEEM